MKKIYIFALTFLCLIDAQFSNAQCNGIKGPNLLGAKGTFSAPFITPNTNAAACAISGTSTYNAVGNVGNALVGCTSTTGISVPCSDYIYTAADQGLIPEFRYTILKNLGDNNGTSCIRGRNDWKGKDHTGDGGYFMVVNGAPNATYSPIFYQIKSIAVCIGATYEFSAWVLNAQPGNGTSSSSPSLSFKVNGEVIANSGLIAATPNAAWKKVGGFFTATTNIVELQVVNATAVAGGNDLAIDDISFNVCESRIAAVDGAGSVANCSGNNVTALYTVTDNSQTNTWYKWQKSIDGGNTFTDVTSGAQTSYIGNTFSLSNNIGVVNSSMNGYKYRLVVSTSIESLSTPACIYFNDYTLIVADCAPLPVQLTSFTGRYSSGQSFLDWQTSQEQNSDKFDLLRSTDGNTFTKVASIKSAGNSSSERNYSYEDNISGYAGSIVYYRLKQIDIDGKATFSSIVKLSIQNSQSNFEVYPNPFTNNFNVSFGAAKTAVATLRIRNSAGSLVYTKSINVAKGNNALLINSLPTLGAGVYYVSINNDELNFNGKLQKL